MKLFRLLGASLVFFLTVAIACGGIWWGSGCAAVEKAVDDRKLQLRQDGDGWFVFGPPEFSKTAEYVGHLAGLLGKRISTAQDGWEKFKLASHCGGSTRTASWARSKGISPDGRQGLVPVIRLLPVGYKIFALSSIVLLVLLAAAAMFLRPRSATAVSTR